MCLSMSAVVSLNVQFWRIYMRAVMLQAGGSWHVHLCSGRVANVTTYLLGCCMLAYCNHMLGGNSQQFTAYYSAGVCDKYKFKMFRFWLRRDQKFHFDEGLKIMPARYSTRDLLRHNVLRVNPASLIPITGSTRLRDVPRLQCLCLLQRTDYERSYSSDLAERSRELGLQQPLSSSTKSRQLVRPLSLNAEAP